MRPCTLEIEGFAAFRERTVIDFRDVELFAIVGATGHGKSTIIDAMCFALYGKVPRHGERDIAPAMTLGVNETKVSLTFEVAQATYIATRVLRRKPSGDGATTRALRLEQLDDDGSTEVLAGSKSEFEPWVQRLIGLDFDQFTKCVVLPQGQFAAFLHARAGDRVAILAALLDLGRYDRMAAAARDRAKRAAGTREALTAERARLGDVTAESLRAAQARVASLGELRATIDGSLPLDAALQTAITAAHDGAARARAAAATLAAIRPPDDVRALTQQIDDARAVADAAYADAIAADKALTESEARVAEFPALEDLKSAAQAHVAHAETTERIANGEAHLREARELETVATEAVAAAKVSLEAAQAELEELQHRHAHVELRASLRKGEPCPVCEQQVSTLPPKLRTTEVRAARKKVQACRATLDKAEVAAQEATGARAKSEALLESLKQQLDAHAARIEAFPDGARLARLLGDAGAAHERANAARTAATRARAAAQAAADRVAGLDGAIQNAEAELLRRREAIVACGVEAPAPARGGLTQQWDALAAWADDVLPDYEKNAAELDDVAAAKKAEQDALRGDLVARAVALEVAPPPDGEPAVLAIRVAEAQRDAAHLVNQRATQLARADELDREIAGAREHETVAAELGRLLDKAHFGQWLVDEALRALVAGASVMLDRLSGGQYALTTDSDGDLLVVDHVNADETRSVRSLSGGETFQASLALALALADRIADLAADGAAALESMFLDEGFGTLDPETLDVVAGTVESLGAGERMVGVVTHVAELAERMPVRFRVRKTGRTSTVTREDA